MIGCERICHQSVSRGDVEVSLSTYLHDGGIVVHCVAVQQGKDRLQLDTENEAFAKRTFEMWVDRHA